MRAPLECVALWDCTGHIPVRHTVYSLSPANSNNLGTPKSRLCYYLCPFQQKGKSSPMILPPSEQKPPPIPNHFASSFQPQLVSLMFLENSSFLSPQVLCPLLPPPWTALAPDWGHYPLFIQISVQMSPYQGSLPS